LYEPSKAAVPDWKPIIFQPEPTFEPDPDTAIEFVWEPAPVVAHWKRMPTPAAVTVLVV